MLLRLIFLPCLLLLCLSIAGQVQKVSGKEYSKLISAADDHVHAGEYQQAQQLYLLAWQIKKDPELGLKISRTYFSLNREVKALSYLEYVSNSGVKNLELARMSGIAYHRSYRFDEAIRWLESYERNTSDLVLKEEARKLIMHARNAKVSITDASQQMKLKNLGSQVNSMYDDYSPVLTADEHTLYFTSRRHTSTGAEQDETGVFYEDIYHSTFVNGMWTAAENVGAPINTEEHDATAGISPNGDELFVYRADNGGDFLLSQQHMNSWTEPLSMGDKINSPGWETSISTTPDEQTVVFSSNRKGGAGGKDIYLSIKNSEGKWSEPVLLSDEINTKYDEESPFIHPDGKTLYFSSEGHNSIGGFDIFRCEIDLKTGKLLSPVVNLGFPISDVGDDVFFVWSADNKRAYFSSDREGGFGLKDIYVAELDYHLQSEVNIMRVKSVDIKNKKSIVSDIILRDVVTGEEQSVNGQSEASLVIRKGHRYELLANAGGYCSYRKVIASDSIPEDFNLELNPQYRKTEFVIRNEYGKGLKPKIRIVDMQTNESFLVSEENRDEVYSIFLKEGGRYSIEILQKGYTMILSTIDIPRGDCGGLQSDTNFTPVKLNFELKALEVGQYEILEAIYFASGKIKPLPESYKQLDFIADFLLLNRDIKAEVGAYTDEVGRSDYNMILSQKRAEAVVFYLVSKGIDPGRLIAKGYGEARPIGKDKSPESLRLNRRVEFVVTSITK